jgi:hypothetical protein
MWPGLTNGHASRPREIERVTRCARRADGETIDARGAHTPYALSTPAIRPEWHPFSELIETGTVTAMPVVADGFRRN